MARLIHIAGILYFLTLLFFVQTGYSNSIKKAPDKSDISQFPEEKIVLQDGQFIKYTNDIVQDKATGWYVWSGEKKPPEILVLDFNDGTVKNFWCYGTCNLSKIRVFAVRSAKK